MKNKNENLDDVVFEERNKNYGAYFLRRSYNKNVTRALFLATLLFLGVISIPLIAGLMNKNKVVITGPDVGTIYMPDPPDPDKKIELPPEPKPEIKIKPFVITVVDSSEAEDASSLIDIIDSTANATPPDIGDGGTLVIDNIKKNDYIDPEKDNDVYIDVKEMPDFIGGIEKMYKYLGENIVYPKPAVETGLTGTVHVKFVVEKDGSISNTILMNDIGGGCGEEALRVVNSMPKWKPGRQNGIAVRVQYILPIRFLLE